MNYRDPERLEALAREFVLGTMPRRARRRFGRLVDEDETVAAAVYALEEQLLGMAWSLTPVAPSELVWRRISRQAGLGRTPRKAQTGPWRSIAAALLLGLLVSTAAWWQELSQPPERVVETVTETVIEPMPLEPAVSVVADAEGNALWVARVYADLARADVAVSTLPVARPANDYQLWVLGADGVPVSLGLLPQTGARQLPLTPVALAALDNGELLAVSLEPTGGSPEAVPTGPVLYTAALLPP
ncbi:MAG: anti-sigma factor [Pseudomonadota bacterium]